MKTANKQDNMYEQMQLMIKKAINVIQEEAAIFSQKPKTHYSGSDDDLVTSADIKAQTMYVEEIKKHFPNDGLIGEENELDIQPKPGYGYFTVDPLDGTKAFGRKQSMGVATMLAHVGPDNVVDTVCIGDVNTGEIYGFGPDQKPKRVRFGAATELGDKNLEPLKKRYLLLKNLPSVFPVELQKVFENFKDMEVMSGSIGLLVARLWKNEVGVMVFAVDNYDTPWDNTPLIGMNKALGIVHIKYDKENKTATIMNPEIPRTVVKRNHIELLTHRDYAEELIRMIENP